MKKYCKLKINIFGRDIKNVGFFGLKRDDRKRKSDSECEIMIKKNKEATVKYYYKRVRKVWCNDNEM